MTPAALRFGPWPDGRAPVIETLIESALARLRAVPWRKVFTCLAAFAGGLLALLYLALTVVPQSGAYATFTVISASMEPAIPRGSIVVVTRIAPAEIRVGDVITFSSSEPPYPTLTHRVLSIDRSDDGFVFQTKGDSNLLPDPFKVSYAGQAGIVRWSVPLIGYAVASSSTPVGRALLGIVLAGLLGLAWFSALWVRPRAAAAVQRVLPVPGTPSVRTSGKKSVSPLRAGILVYIILAILGIKPPVRRLGR